MKLSLNRLKNRLIAFRDENLKLDILPMLNGFADVTCLNQENTGSPRLKNRSNFNYTMGRQKVKNTITNNKEIDMTIFLIQGTVITQYNRETAQRIQYGAPFQSEADQLEYLAEQKRKYAAQVKTANDKYEEFKAVGETNIPELVN